MINLDKAKSVFLKSCDAAVKIQKKDGSMPSGHNGPYFDKETSLRNTSHWIVSFSKAYILTKKTKYLDAVDKGTNYIINSKNSLGAFLCRDKPGKDQCNGLIGQAWIIEGLIESFRVSKNEEALNLSIETFLKIPFSHEKGLWKRLEHNGDILGFDNTFNHQLWLALAGVLILSVENNMEIKKRCKIFFEKIFNNLKLKKNGRIQQAISLGYLNDFVKPTIKKFLKPESLKLMKLKEIGYHAFNTLAFSRIKYYFPNEPFFTTTNYFKIIKYLDSEEYKNLIYKSIYGFKYNPPGFEVFYTHKLNSEILKTYKFSNQLFYHQIEHHFDFNKKLHSKNVFDENTSSARIYELSFCL